MVDLRRIGFFSVTGDLASGGSTAPPDITPDPDPVDNFFNTGTRRLHVSPTSSPPIDGTVIAGGLTFTTIQAALNAAQSGDVITVASGIYNERPSLTNFAGATNFGLWLVAEERGQAIIQDVVQNLQEGTVTWTSEGNGVFSRSHSGADVFMASLGGTESATFLPRYDSESDLRASTLTFNSSGRNKPPQGCAVEGGRLYVRLPGNVNPSGLEIIVPQEFGRDTVSFENADNVIIDGFVVRGAGTSDAISFDENCANPHVRNCVITHTRLGIRCADNTLIETVEYHYPGFKDWVYELQALNNAAPSMHIAFEYVKNYFSQSGNSFLEGGINAGRGTPPNNCEIRDCLIHDNFDGVRFGELNNSVCHNNVMRQCFDDAVQMEGFRATDDGENNTFRHNLIIDCHVPISIQDDLIGQPQFIYRNVYINESETIIQSYAMLKTIHSTPDRSHVYNNTFIHRGSGNIQGFGNNKWVWSDFSSHEGDCVEDLFNNIFIFEDRLDQDSGGGPNPGNIRNNLLVAPSPSTLVQGTNGIYAGDQESDAGVNFSDFTLTASSPARGAGITRSSLGLPDVTSTTDLDLGAHPFGSNPTGPTAGEAWPRSRDLIFRETQPERWVPV